MIKSRERVQQFGEVFTPPWMVSKMLDLPEISAALDDPTTKFLEPCCGEGAFLTEILRRKIAARPNFTFIHLRNIFGIELLLDNLGLAKTHLANIFATAYALDPADDRIWKILNRNIIQGDALKLLAKPPAQTTLDLGGDIVPTYADLLAEKFGLNADQIKNMIIISNPPYQENNRGDTSNYARPVYHKFIEAFHRTSDRVMVIHPARCLFDAGATPKDFNEKILNDPHVKVAIYEPDSSKVFTNTNVDVRGGIAVTYRDRNKNFGKIGIYIHFDELRSIFQKVVNRPDFSPFSEIVYARAAYRISENFPIAKKIGTSIGTNIFDTLKNFFFEVKPDDGHEYIQILGRVGVQRVYKWFRRDYIRENDNFGKYKVFIPSSNGSGALGEKLSTMLVGLPLVGCTETFTGAGAFDSEAEATACMKYVKTKFARALLGILKVTQHNPSETWRFVPLQDFTAGSDINWLAGVPEIDRQLYRKYGLTAAEVAFIEEKVKPMP